MPHVADQTTAARKIDFHPAFLKGGTDSPQVGGRGALPPRRCRGPKVYRWGPRRPRYFLARRPPRMYIRFSFTGGL
jgi:hypothetical protein